MTERRAEALVPADHPCIAGHFPGNPIVPGVVLIDCVAAVVRASLNVRICGIPNVKFVQPLRPGVAFSIYWTPTQGGVRFRCESAAAGAAQVHVQGVLSIETLPDNAGFSQKVI